MLVNKHRNASEKVFKFALADVIGSIICLMFMVVELAVAPTLSTYGIVFAALYVLLLIALPAKPTLCCVALTVLNAVLTIIPVLVVVPTTFWGTWFAMGLLARKERPWVVSACVGLNVCATLASSLVTGGGITTGLVVLSCSYVVSGLVGFAVQKQAEALQAQKEHELSRQRVLFQEERLENLHVLHDQVAGDLTHIVQRCRLWLSDPKVSQQEKPEIAEIEVMTSEVLHHLRTNVIEPARKSLERHHQTLATGMSQSGGEELPEDIHDDGNHSAGQADRNAEAMNGERLAAATAEREGLHPHVNREEASGESSEHELHRAAARNSHHDLTAKACKAQRRLASLGFSGHIDIVGDRNQLSHKQVKAVSRLLDELSNNIARHGKPGEYLFRVGLGNGSFGILASNLCKDEQEFSGASRGVGLRLITRTVEQLGGDIQTNTDDGEWTIAIRVSTDEDA